MGVAVKIGRLGMHLLFTVMGISLVTFALMCLAPGDAAEIWVRSLQGLPPEEAVASLRQEWGLQESYGRQYLTWLGNVLRLNLGFSFSSGEAVSREILRRLPATLELTAGAFLFMVCASLLMGLTGAFCPGSWVDRGLNVFTMLITSLPGYWLGLLLIFLFAVKIPLFPVAGRGGLLHGVLPTLTLGAGLAAVYGQVVRSSVLEVFSQDYIKLAVAKGLSWWDILTGHVLRNALVPLIHLWAMSLGHFLGGSVIVETIFAWPGLGSLLAEGIARRDYPVVMGCVVFMTALYVVINLLADLCHVLLDPRVRQAASR